MASSYLEPPRSMTTYAVGAPLVRWLREEVKRAHEELGRYRVLDVGCGIKPYEALLEHCDDPAQAVRELKRVTSPGGRLLASRHGVMSYYPSPTDYWRRTHAGLAKLFTENAVWSSARVIPGSGTTACVGMLVSINLDLALRYAHVGGLARPVIAAINWTAGAIDSRWSRLRDPTQGGTLFANFHILADVPR